jgi:hypothetical protein
MRVIDDLAKRRAGTRLWTSRISVYCFPADQLIGGISGSTPLLAKSTASNTLSRPREAENQFGATYLGALE